MPPNGPAADLHRLSGRHDVLGQLRGHNHLQVLVGRGAEIRVRHLVDANALQH